MGSDARELAAHAAIALSRYVRESAREGRSVPAELVAVMEFCADAVRERQGATGVVGCGDPAHAEPMSTQTLLLSKREAAHLLRVSTRTLERRIAAGELRTVTVAGAVRVRRVDLDEYVAGLGRPRSFRDGVDVKGAAS